MLTLSSSCLAISLADEAGTLALTEREGRFGPFVAICDDHGLIEVAMSWDEAHERINALRERRA